MSRDAAPSDRRARLARALRENLKRRKAQGRGRAAASVALTVASTAASAGTRDDSVDAGVPVSTGKTKDD
jgi:hypothetical protein